MKKDLWEDTALDIETVLERMSFSSSVVKKALWLIWLLPAFIIRLILTVFEFIIYVLLHPIAKRKP